MGEGKADDIRLLMADKKQAAQAMTTPAPRSSSAA